VLVVHQGANPTGVSLVPHVSQMRETPNNDLRTLAKATQPTQTAGRERLGESGSPPDIFNTELHWMIQWVRV
jgi:hypothetical protein